MSIGRNATYNLIGFAVPTVLALATVPAYLSLIGPARYGVLSLAWLILGYFGLFDLGLSRATTQRIASLRDASPEERTKAFATALVTNMGIGLVGASLLFPAAWYMFGTSMALEPALRAEVLRAVPYLAMALPIATTLGVLSGALVGREKFRDTNRISVISTSLFQVLPLGVAWAMGPDLPRLMIASIAARMIGVAMLWRACRREYGPVGWRNWDPAQMRQLLTFGAWVTISGLFAPLLVFSDRFAIGTLIGAVAVTVYTVPMDAMRRLAGIAIALSNALFPRLAMASEDEARDLSRKAVGAYFAVLTPPVVGMLVIMDPLLRLWLGDSIGGQAAPLARLFLIATWVNCYAQIPFVRLQAQGRPDMVTKILLVQLPFYLAALWFALKGYGLTGAAWVYLGRVIVDTLALFHFGSRRIPLWPLLALTGSGLCAASVWLDSLGRMALLPTLAYGILAGLAMLPIAVFVAPERMRELAWAPLSILRRKAKS